jgi:transposase
MPRRVRIATYVSTAELADLYGAARDPVERSQCHILWLLAQGRSRAETARITGYSVRWVSEVVRRYNAEGPAALRDHRHASPGAMPLLSAEQQRELWAALHGPAPNGGAWRSRDVSEWIPARTGRVVPIQRGWAYLRKLGSRDRPVR